MINKLLKPLEAVNPWRYVKSAFWLTTSRVISMAVSLLATFYIARALGPQNFGELSYAQSVLGILAIFSALTASLYRDLVKNKDQENTQLGTAWFVSASTIFITIALVVLYTFFIPHDQLTLWVIGILAIAQFFAPFSIIRNVFYAKTETKYLSIADFLIHVFISGAKITAMALGHGILILASIMFLEQVVIAVTQTFLYIKVHKGSLLKWHFSPTYAKQLILDSLPIVIIAGSGAISGRIDQVFLKYFLDTTTVGLYSVAVQLSEVWHLIPGLILGALFPAIVNVKDNKQVYRRRLGTLAVVFIIFGIGISIIITLIAPFIIPLIYGTAFILSIPLLQIYIWSLTGMVLGFLVSNFLMAENLRIIQIVTGVLPMIINVILNLILIPTYGAYGAALATLISYSLLPLIPFTFKRVRNILL